MEKRIQHESSLMILVMARYSILANVFIVSWFTMTRDLNLKNTIINNGFSSCEVRNSY